MVSEELQRLMATVARVENNAISTVSADELWQMANSSNLKDDELKFVWAICSYMRGNITYAVQALNELQETVSPELKLISNTIYAGLTNQTRLPRLSLTPQEHVSIVSTCLKGNIEFLKAYQAILPGEAADTVLEAVYECLFQWFFTLSEFQPTLDPWTDDLYIVLESALSEHLNSKRGLSTKLRRLTSMAIRDKNLSEERQKTLRDMYDKLIDYNHSAEK